MKGDATVMTTFGRRECERRRERRGDQIGRVDKICLEGLVARGVSVGFGIGIERDPGDLHLHQTLLSTLRSRWARAVAGLGCPLGWTGVLVLRGRSLPCC